MYKVELNINEQYLMILLAFLDGLGEAQQLVKVAKQKSGDKSSDKTATITPQNAQILLKNFINNGLLPVALPAKDPLSRWVKPLRQRLTVEDLLKEHTGGQRSRTELDALFAQMNLEQPLDVLLNDLKS
jgi:hypothetical protein